jgi:multiple sugar transport system substrate-binding protein
MKGRFAVSASLTAMAAAVTLAACGGSDGGGGGSASEAPAKTAALSDKPMELTFLWFEWPPAAAL